MRPPLIRRAFTIIELMVVVAVLAALMALMAPQLSKAKEIAHMTQCANNLHNNGAAIRLYGYNHKEDYPDFFYSFVPGQNDANTVVILYKPKKAASTGWTYLDPACMVCPDDEAPGAVHVLDPKTGAITDFACSYDVNVDFLIRKHLQDQTNTPSSLALMFDGDIGSGAKQGAYLGTDNWAPTAFLPRHISNGSGSDASSGGKGNGNNSGTTTAGADKKYGGVLWADGHVTMEESLTTENFVMQGDQPWVHGHAGNN